MENTANSSRRIFIKQLAASTAAVAVGTNLLAGQEKATLPNEAINGPPSNSNTMNQISWDTLRGHFRISFNLDPSASTTWEEIKPEHSQGSTGVYRSDNYQLKISEKAAGKQTSLINYELTRADGKPFQMLECHLECKTSYSGVYKIFTPTTVSQQNYLIDLPFRINGYANAESNQPVIWMQQTDGRNTLTLGLLDQVAITDIEGSTYDTGNGGEAPGIANSYVRVVLKRIFHNDPPILVFKDTIYVNADSDITWFEALKGYSAAVDVARDFKIHSVSEWALNPMWHSWYAHADKIDEKQIREDAIRANDLGVTTIELDAGWNIPREAVYSFDSDGDYEFDAGRFPDPKGMIDTMHAAGQRFILHVAPLLMGKDCKAWDKMKDCKIMVEGKQQAHLDPRLKKVHDYLLTSWENMFTKYGIDGLWYDFLEIPDRPDKLVSGVEIVSPDIHVAYTKLMQSLYNKAIALNTNAVIIMRRSSANLNAKTFCTHVWPMDTPQDYNMNRRDIVYMKTFGPGVLTHACCTSWAISESDVNVARQMASIVLAGVPAFSVILAESPATHNAIVKAWLAFYELNKSDLILGRMTPLLPTPPSAALRIEGEQQTFFGFFEAIPGLIEATKSVNKIILINAFNKRTSTRLEGVKGNWQIQVYDEVWRPMDKTLLNTDANGGLNINLTGPNECHVIVLTKDL
jgi:glycosyl hydrolase family 31